MRIPACYGFLNDPNNSDCQHCLINDQCKVAQDTFRTNKVTNQTKPMLDSTPIPKDKRSIILAICDKFGIVKTYTGRDKVQYDVTNENKDTFVNLDFLLTSLPSLTKLLQTKVVNERMGSSEHNVNAVSDSGPGEEVFDEEETEEEEDEGISKGQQGANW